MAMNPGVAGSRFSHVRVDGEANTRGREDLAMQWWAHGNDIRSSLVQAWRRLSMAGTSRRKKRGRWEQTVPQSTRKRVNVCDAWDAQVVGHDPRRHRMG